MQIRAEKDEDIAAVKRLNERAFESPVEAGLVDVLREHAQPVISLVAVEAGEIVGHILFSPVVLSVRPDLKIMGLAPMAVVPERQRQGIGSELVRAGIKACGKLGSGAIVVLGHPDYYPRFGFRPASRFGIDCQFDVPEGVFMAVELQPGYLDGASGMTSYHEAFTDL